MNLLVTGLKTVGYLILAKVFYHVGMVLLYIFLLSTFIFSDITSPLDKYDHWAVKITQSVVYEGQHLLRVFTTYVIPVSSGDFSHVKADDKDSLKKKDFVLFKLKKDQVDTLTELNLKNLF